MEPGGYRHWLWLLTTPVVALCHVTASRVAKDLKAILGDEYKAVLCSDMYSAYNAFHKRSRQLCRARIIRGIKGSKHGCRCPDAVQSSTWMLGVTGRMFALWHAFKRGHVDRQTLVSKSIIIRGRMSRSLHLYASSSDRPVAKTAKSLLKHWHCLFTFLERGWFEPTNNTQIAFALWNEHREDFGHEASCFYCFLGALRPHDSKVVPDLSGEAMFLGDVFWRHTHMIVIKDVPKAVVDHQIGQHIVIHAHPSSSSAQCMAGADMSAVSPAMMTSGAPP